MELIAEFCQNHNGDTSILHEMVYQAKESGCTYAKIQSISPDMLTYRERFETGLFDGDRIVSIKRPFKEERGRLKGLELTLDQQSDFVKLCEKVGIKPLTTAFTRGSVGDIKSIGFKDIKIASYDCSAVPLLKDVAQQFNRIIVSTGATYDDEIKAASVALSNTNFSLLHCVTLYPTPLKEYHLARIQFLRKYSKTVGWSDHSHYERDGIKGTIAAIYYGADIIERHFTILDRKQTKDGPVSIGPKDCAKLIELSKLSKADLKLFLEEEFPEYPVTLGVQDRSLSDEEILNRDYYRGRFATLDKSGQYKFNWEE